MTNDGPQLSEDLDDVIEILASHPRLLVASDFDGTISSFASHYQDAKIDPDAWVALRDLCEQPNTFVAVISGRQLSFLEKNLAGLNKLTLVGSHGHEIGIDQSAINPAVSHEFLSLAAEIMRKVTVRFPGTTVELKPHGVAFHYRPTLEFPIVELDILKNELKKLGTGVVLEGDKVLEYCAVTTNKGEALAKIRENIAPSITVFVGDDVTDESAFKVLDSSNISIKIGLGPTCAGYRIKTERHAIEFLGRLAMRRAQKINSVPFAPIDQHLFLSDLRTAAIVGPGASINWLCCPRLDGAPLFGALIGGPSAGHFEIKTRGECKQSYLSNTMIGVSRFDTLTVTDFLDASSGRSFQRAGRTDLVRIVEGSGEIEIIFAPKFNFGRVPTRLSGISDGIKIDCGQQPLVLMSPGCQWRIEREGLHDVARCAHRLDGGRLVLCLLMGTASPLFPNRSIDTMLADTSHFWSGWFGTLKLPKTATQLVGRSALTLRGLTHGPTGAIAAAATTSLPETIGGVRNWDYRYCWPRDACLSASALLRVGAPGPAMRLLDWILGILFDSDRSGFMAPLYTVTGKSVPMEAEVPEAIGYRGSRPVRIGNLAAEQLQLDTLGPIAELMLKLVESGAALTTEHLRMCEELVKLVSERWLDPDSGIWEVRGPQRHFVHSKLMCWYTVTSCIAVSKYLGLEQREWADLAEQIRAQIESEGFNTSLQSYVAAYDLHQSDAALLWVILSGFHAPEDPRCQGTLDYVIKSLVHDGGVYRYHFDDALNGREGEFIICRAWLIEALAMSGRMDEAHHLFSELASRVSSLGLIAEQWDTIENRALGNYPQAYSHLGLINAACALSRS